MQYRCIIFPVIITFLKGAFSEYCRAYWDASYVRQRGFNCPAKIRLVGKVDVYCCESLETPGDRECCNDRTRSVYHRDMTYGEELLKLYLPALVLAGMLVMFGILYSLMQPKNAEVKHEIIGD
ncbi:hypothetical protein DPMN_113387 [Dreissena polymorpha]|uniref:Shisa N-terminal domain-containing protein n=1 Tax=Dreissena polymorpha TaxID=45954 RepID=A0A9D4KHD2_DREPO|nr:hypothetical protein DPMN_113387 [Dreissena polymorpha]